MFNLSRRCLKNYIKISAEINLNCPFNNEKNESCKSLLTQIEIESLLDECSHEIFKTSLATHNEILSTVIFEKNNEKASTSKQSEMDTEIQELIKSGCIMRCPNCNILLEKQDSGCQFMRCYICKVDICYVTRQARWGPLGKGDTSGGCMCGVDGKKCHSDCRNCH